MPEQQQQVSQGQKSGFGHHMLEAERIIQLKTEFENKIMTSDLSSFAARDELLSLAKIKASEIKALASDDERIEMSTLLKAISDCSQNISTTQYNVSSFNISEAMAGVVVQQSLAEFKNRLHEWLDYFIKIQDRANLQYNKMKELGEMARYLKFNEVDTRFTNSYGLYISPEMEFFCRGLALRAMHNQNNIIIIGAKMGKGKSTFAMAGATTLSEMLGVPFSVNVNVLLNESREQCEKLLARLPNGSSLIFDQAGNQLGAASRWEDDQVNLLNKIDLNRFHTLTLWVNWHASKALDKEIRERVSTHEVAIDKVGGPAIIKGFNLNPHNSTSVVSQKDKKKVALTPDQAHAITEGDSLKLLDVPFYQIDRYSTPEALKLWSVYSDKKEKSNKYASKIVGHSVGVDLLYNDFLATLDPNTVRIDSNALNVYGESKHTFLSIHELAKRIARATNQKTNKIFINTNLMDVNEGYIEIDRYAATYIERIRSEREGALKYQEERDSDAA